MTESEFDSDPEFLLEPRNGSTWQTSATTTKWNPVFNGLLWLIN